MILIMSFGSFDNDTRTVPNCEPGRYRSSSTQKLTNYNWSVLCYMYTDQLTVSSFCCAESAV